MKTQRVHLLLVGSDVEFLHEVEQSLPGGECNLETIDSPHAALEKLARSDFDVLICSDGEPIGPGFLDSVRTEYPCTVCVIVFTNAHANGNAEIPDAAFDVLTKPLNPFQFALCIKRALAYRRALISEREARAGIDRLNRHLSERVRRARELLISNEQLADANRAKDRFLAAMSHELRTPLTAISGAVRILQSPHIADMKARSMLDMLDRNVYTLKRLLDDLFDCSRIASGKLSLEMTLTSLNECIAAAIETMRSKAAEAGVQLHALIPETGFTVKGNPLRLQQIAWNLIDNAIKFTAPGGRIVVSLSRNREAVDITVCDSGVGLLAEDKEKIFEPFAQAHEEEAQKKGGLGLGLALVRNLTELHNGSVRAESDGPGAGSRFIVTLPLKKEAFPARRIA